MTPEQWERISEIYHAALEISSGAGRATFLEKACAGDESLRREVESLLAADSAAGDFIAEPAGAGLSPLLAAAAAAFEAENAEPDSLVGKSLGHYSVVSRLGVGGMGEVYLARDTKLNRLAALKFLPSAVSRDPNYLRRFQTEAKAAATLNHPNVAVVYSVEETDGRPFITMEYVEGKTLDAFIPSGGLDLKIFLEWFAPLSDALAHAHDKGVVHRDIKPGNIMITSADGVPKILDFGLAQIDRAVAAPNREADDRSTLNMTDPGQVFGTPSYMSPEQAEGRPVDRRSDVFSFGVVMYQALTGVRPFKGDSYASIVSEVIAKEPRPIAEIKPDAPFLLARLVMRCLCKDRRQRFQSMREVCVILNEIKAAVEAGRTRPEASSGLRFLRLLRTTERERRPAYARLTILAPLLALLIVGAAVSAFYFFNRDGGAAPRTPTPALNFENIAMRKLSQTNNVAFAQVAPDGKTIVYTTIEENDDRALWIRRVEDKNALRLLAPQPVFFWGGIIVSPDASQIYYIVADRSANHGTLYRISSLGGAPRKLAETVNDLGALSPDGGRRVLYVRYGDERMQMLEANAADGSDERLIYEADAAKYIFRDPKYSLDGRSIFFIKFERIDGEEFWSLVEIPADAASGDRPEKVILPLRKPRISEIVVLKDGSGLLVNATDAASNLQQLYHVALPGGRETRVTNDLNSYFGVSASDDGRTIVATQRETAKDVWIVPTVAAAAVGGGGANSAEMRKLTAESNVYTNAVWTPDGRIVYDALDNNRPHIWIMDGDGRNAEQLTPNDSFDYEPRVSPDGRFIVFTSRRTGDTKIWRMNIDGTNPQLLTPVTGATFAPLITPPPGETILFQWQKDSGRVMGRVPLAGGAVVEDPPLNPNTNLFAVSPDGRRVAFAFYDAPNRRYKVRVRPLAAAEEPSIVFDIAPVNFLVWTADGNNLLYRELEPRGAAASGSTVWRQPIDGGRPQPFLSVEPDSVFNLSMSKDGKRLIVVRGRFTTDAVMLTQKQQQFRSE